MSAGPAFYPRLFVCRAVDGLKNLFHHYLFSFAGLSSYRQSNHYAPRPDSDICSGNTLIRRRPRKRRPSSCVWRIRDEHAAEIRALMEESWAGFEQAPPVFDAGQSEDDAPGGAGTHGEQETESRKAIPVRRMPWRRVAVAAVLIGALGSGRLVGSAYPPAGVVACNGGGALPRQKQL